MRRSDAGKGAEVNKPTFNEVTGSTPDAVVVQIREAERTGKHLVLDRIVRIGKPMPAALILHRGAKPVAIWRVKTYQIVTQGSRTTSVVEWQERGLYALAADGSTEPSLYLVQDGTAVEVDALEAVIRAMFDAKQAVLA
jgi:hypothetical protein